MVLRKILFVTNKKIPNDRNFHKILVTTISQKFYETALELFPTLAQHHLENAVNEEPHVFILIKEIVTCYTKIRIYNLLKKYTLVIQGPSVRRQLNKLILFNHQ